LPKSYARWLLDEPVAQRFADAALELLEDANVRGVLAAASAASVSAYDRRAYASGTLAQLLAAQKRRLK
jgi:hypothetical protein